MIERKKVASIEKFTLELCRKCNSIRIGRDWLKIGLDEAIQRLIFEKLQVEPDFELHEIVISDKSVILKGILNGDFVEFSVPFSYGVHKISCPKCSMESGGYYEAIIQLRAEKRLLRSEEIEKAKEIVNKSILEQNGQKDFISKFEVLKNGVDFYLGSRKLGERVARRIAEELGGKIFESRKLHTRVDGRDVYRFTFLIRLPEYEDLDIVVKNDTLHVVKNARMGKGIELATGKYASISNAKVAVKKESFSWGIITNLDESSAEVMTEKGVVVVQRPFGAEIGKEVFIFEYKNKSYAFPRDL